MPEDDEMDGTNGGWTVFVQAKKSFSPGSGSLLHGTLSQWRLTSAQSCVCLLCMSGSTDRCRGLDPLILSPEPGELDLPVS